ncbi:hypothetical protein Fcan01_14378 [Folsomia candida]|uniref:Uncharacterized protein n=1 Tax=Folsomia candida TaxID=158441 RepID=A0A226DZJ2_FOLCA|nr:hypothetical protein Fcan01_14378 [Folsomia candida]
MNKAGGGSGGNSCLRDYGRICTICGTSATVVGGIYAIAALLMRYYLSPDSLQYFEMVPTYVPAITVNIKVEFGWVEEIHSKMLVTKSGNFYTLCGLLTLTFSWKRYRNFIMLKFSAYLALCNSVLSSVFTLAVIFVNLKVFNAMNTETCEINASTNTCGCKVEPFSPAFPKEQTIIFENLSSTCTYPVAVLSFCLVLMVPTSMCSVFLSLFMYRLLDELID